MQAQLSSDLTINWRFFSLEQVNSSEAPGWRLWAQPPEYESRGRLAFQAAEAARKQGPESFDRFHMALLRARHEQGKKIFLRETVLDVAREVGLDVRRFDADLADPASLVKLGEDHTYAADHLGVFGTPTLVFANARAAYLKMKPAAPPEESLAVWQDLYRTIAGRPYIEEIKRPVAPPHA